MVGPDDQRIGVRGGVILACGGFEADPNMQRQYWQGQPVMSTSFLGNTGDGIRMAVSVGADLWHMWHYHGTYGFRVAGYPLGVRTKRLPDWFPQADGTVTFSEMFTEDRAVKMPWVLVDRSGRRFMNEYEPYMQDTGHRPLEYYRPETQTHPRIPCWLVADEAGRQQFPWGQPLYNDEHAELSWSPDNSVEVQNGVIQRANSIEELATLMAIDPETLRHTVETWNQSEAANVDEAYQRPASSMMPIKQPPYYAAQIWPLVSNTQGGPVHDSAQRILNPYGEPIPGLYAAGELGSVFGHLYLSGGNVTECFVGGQIAGEEAAAQCQ